MDGLDAGPKEGDRQRPAHGGAMRESGSQQHSDKSTAINESLRWLTKLVHTCMTAERTTADRQLLVFLFSSIMAMLEGERNMNPALEKGHKTAPIFVWCSWGIKLLF